MCGGRRAHTDLRAFSLDQGRNWSAGCGERIVRRNRLLPLRCATRVVAVETEPTLGIELSLGPRSENQTCLGAGQKLVGRGGVQLRKVDRAKDGGDVSGSQAGDDIICVVASQG